MARGKYAERAEAKAARESAIAEAARLRKELDEVRTAAATLDRANIEAQAHYAETVKSLRVQLAANTSDKVERLQAQLDASAASVREVESANAAVRESHNKLFEIVCDHMADEHGWTGADAVQWVADRLGFGGYITEDVTGKRAGAEGAYRIEVARGIRSTKAPSGLVEDQDDLSAIEARRPLNRSDRPW